VTGATRIVLRLARAPSSGQRLSPLADLIRLVDPTVKLLIQLAEVGQDEIMDEQAPGVRSDPPESGAFYTTWQIEVAL